MSKFNYKCHGATKQQALPLFDRQLWSHRNDPQTSYDAAERAQVSAAWWREKILDTLKKYPNGLTAKELSPVMKRDFHHELTGWDTNAIYHAIQRRVNEIFGIERTSYVRNGASVMSIKESEAENE